MHRIYVAVNATGTARVLWGDRLTVVDVLSKSSRGNVRSFDSQEDAEHFAAGVQAGLISAGMSATVEIVEVPDVAS